MCGLFIMYRGCMIKYNSSRWEFQFWLGLRKGENSSKNTMYFERKEILNWLWQFILRLSLHSAFCSRHHRAWLCHNNGPCSVVVHGRNGHEDYCYMKNVKNVAIDKSSCECHKYLNMMKVKTFFFSMTHHWFYKGPHLLQYHPVQESGEDVNHKHLRSKCTFWSWKIHGHLK